MPGLPVYQRLSTPLGSGLCVAREPHLPRTRVEFLSVRARSRARVSFVSFLRLDPPAVNPQNDDRAKKGEITGQGGQDTARRCPETQPPRGLQLPTSGIRASAGGGPPRAPAESARGLTARCAITGSCQGFSGRMGCSIGHHGNSSQGIEAKGPRCSLSSGGTAKRSCGSAACWAIRPRPPRHGRSTCPPRSSSLCWR